MRCPRCGGLLIRNWWDPNDGVQEDKMRSTRCVNCGCINDPVILANRRQMLRPRMTPTRGSMSSLRFSMPSPQGSM